MGILKRWLENNGFFDEDYYEAKEMEKEQRKNMDLAEWGTKEEIEEMLEEQEKEAGEV